MRAVASLPGARGEVSDLCARSRVVVVYEGPLSLRVVIQFAVRLTFRGGGLGGRLVPVKLSNALTRRELDDLLGTETSSALFIFSIGNRNRSAKADVALFAQLVARDHAAQKGMVVLEPGNARHERSLRSGTKERPAFDLGCFAAWPTDDGGEFDIRSCARVAPRKANRRSADRTATDSED